MSSPIFTFSPFAPGYSLSSSTTSKETLKSNSSPNPGSSPKSSSVSPSSPAGSDLDPFSLEKYEEPSFLYSYDLGLTRRESCCSIASDNSDNSTFSDCSTVVGPSSSLPTSQSPSSLSESLLEEYYSTPSNALGLTGVEDWRSFGDGEGFDRI